MNSSSPSVQSRRTFLRNLGAAAVLPAVAPVSSGLSASTGEGAAPSRRLAIYQPTVVTNPIYFPHPGRKPLLGYNHDVDIIRFRGRFIAAWNANPNAKEDVPGQYNYQSNSDDFVTWSNPVRPFTREGGATNPVELDNQWQPAFVNFHDEVLFCAWCTYTGDKTYVSRSLDGDVWENVEVPSSPPALAGKTLGFPTSHGLLSSKGVIMFACSLPYRGKLKVGTTRYAGILLSGDGGKSWEWSDPIEAVSWSEAGESPARFGGEMIAIWEPTIWENSDGSFGLMIRNSTAQERSTRPSRLEKPERMILAATSPDGRRWTRARPIEVESLCSRIFAFSGGASPQALQMVMNDWPTGWPESISSNRYFLSLFCAPVADPDLLLPGPLVQPAGGRAYYPDGFVEDNRLYIGYTYIPGIHSSVVSPLPDYRAPFLLPRGSREGLVLTDQHAVLAQRESTLGLVLTAGLTSQPELNLGFDFNLKQYDGHPFTILTCGGKTRNGLTLVMRYGEKEKRDILEVRCGGRVSTLAGGGGIGVWNTVRMTIRHGVCQIGVNGATTSEIAVDLLRKIAFGGLYDPPLWPVGTQRRSELLIALDSISLA